MISRPIAVQSAYGKTAKLKDGLAYCFAGDGTGMYAHASNHADPINDGDAFARLCRGDGGFLARRAAADNNKIVFGRAQLGRLNSLRRFSRRCFVYTSLATNSTP